MFPSCTAAQIDVPLQSVARCYDAAAMTIAGRTENYAVRPVIQIELIQAWMRDGISVENQ